jgi:hypothetical protein
VEASSTGGQGSRRAVAPSDDDVFSDFIPSFIISNLSYDRSTASSEMIPPLNAI